MTSKERQERIAILKKQAELYKQIVEGTPSPEDMAKYYELLQELTKIQRIEDGFQDIMVFAKNYFTGTPPHDLLKPDTPSPRFHYDLVNSLREAVLDPWERKIATAAPRSHSKSTWVTNIFPLWCTCYVEDVKERYWVIISDKQDNARKFLDVIKSEFEDNELLVADFGNLKGSTWNSLEIVTANNVKISAHGAGEALRGLRFGSFRPSVIMDDIESDESCSTSERIQKSMDWLLRTVLPLGDPKKSKYFIVGTVIHYHSVLNQIMNNFSDWEAYKYQAIEQYPERLDLWNKWEEIYHSRTEGDNPMESSRIARKKAMQFYEENKDEMHRGSKVLWQERLDLLALMEKRARDRQAFLTEYQNTPIDDETRIFRKIWYYEPDDVNLKDLDIFGACDPSLGKNKRSDPSVILTLGRHKKTGIMYVLDVDAKRRHPDQIIQDIFNKARVYDYQRFCIETIAFQQFFKDEVTKRSAEFGIYLPVTEYKSTVKKEVRITALEPLFTNGHIRILPTMKDFEEQLLFYPKTAHDDILDSCNMSVELAKKRSGQISYGHI